MSSNLAQRLLEKIDLLFDPLQDAATSKEARRRLLATLGWDLEVVAGYSLDDLVTSLEQVATASQTLAGLSQDPPESLEEVGGILDDAGSIFETLRQLSDLAAAVQVPDVPTLGLALQQLGVDLAQLLVIIYLDRYNPLVLQLARLLTLAEAPVDVHVDAYVTPIVDPATKVVFRYPVAKPALRLDRISSLLADPVAHLRTEYLIDDLADEPATRASAERLFGRVASVLRELGIDNIVGADIDAEEKYTLAAQSVLSRSLTLMFPANLSPEAHGAIGVTLMLLSQEEGGPALAIVPTGELQIDATTGEWRIGISVGGAAGGFAIGSGGLTLPTGVSGQVYGAIRGEKVAEEGQPTAIIGSSTGTRLELGGQRAGLEFRFDGERTDLGVLLEVISAALVVAAGDGDGFLQQILPPDGLRTGIDVALGWSTGKGLYFRGGAGLEATLPVNKTIAGVLTIDTVSLGLRADGEGLRAHTSTAVSLQLGPVAVAVEGVGVQAVMTFPEGGGNLGVVNLALQFKPPTGAGLAIDAGVVVGGGYLFFDIEKQQYAGAVHLELAETLSLTAFGLLTTRMPDGSPGFSLLVLIAATFSPPVQLGYGFTLSGVGGLVGINRTASVDTLRAGLRTGSLGSVLFPQDPIRNAPQIISDLAAIFPPAPGRFLVGPMVQLGWGTPTLLTIELGIVLELPAPVRLLLLGRLKVALPEPEAPIVRLQLDAIGVIDFASGDVSIDAVLYDSKIAAFTITGGMALRANFGNKPDMVLAIGGFNPRFQPPAGFPTLDRVAINLAAANNLAAGDTPRLRLEAYFALTTNTVQFGALLDLYASAGPFSIAGMLGLDVLIQLAPFGFIADLGASLALKYNNTSVMSIALAMTLTGPTPWHAWGKASYEVLFFSGSIDFDVTIGPSQQPALPPPIDIRPLLVAALREQGNWSTELPRGEHPLVALRDQLGAPELLVHPLADLHVTQKIAPFGHEISRFGVTTPEPYRTFTLGIVDADKTVRTTAADGVQAINEHFAPAQFRQMTDDEKLTAPAFEQMQAGIRFTMGGYDCGTAIVEPSITYAVETIHRAAPAAAAPAPARIAPSPETMIVAPAMTGIEEEPVMGEDVIAANVVSLSEPGPAPAKPFILTTGFVESVANTGAAATAAFARTGDRKFEVPIAPAVALRARRFAVVTGRGLDAEIEKLPDTGAVPGPGLDIATVPDYTTAVEALQSRLAVRPADRGRLSIVPVYAGEIE